MTKRRLIGFVAWGVVTLSATVWVLSGNFGTEFGPLVTALIGASLAYGPARAVALWRTDREDPVQPQIVPLRICLGVTGLIMFGPFLAAALGWINILPAFGLFLGGIILMSWAIAVFSDGYQSLWLDALIFHGDLTPPEEDWVNKKL